MSEVFWSSPASEPKRGFRFLVHINSIPTWICKKCSKPEFTIKEVTHKYLNHSFYYPGTAEWSPLKLEMVDPVNPDASKTLQNIIRESGYHFPVDGNDTSTLSKQRAVAALGQVLIQQIDADGKVNESWAVKNGWVSKISYGELSYDSDELVTVSLEIRYDYAVQDETVGGEIVPAGNF
jgi:hypothetical protein